MTISLHLDWLHVLAGLGIIAGTVFVVRFAWGVYQSILFYRGMK
jgi:hypothetical protein